MNKIVNMMRRLLFRSINQFMYPMKKSFITSFIMLVGAQIVLGQKEIFVANLANTDDANVWSLHNRNASYSDALYLDSQPGDGILMLNDLVFGNCTIELEIQGKDTPGRSFVGVAFHIENDSTFDAIYFRAFNFKNPDRNDHSVQYISHPEYPWHRLREESPGQYENTVSPVPNPVDWFKVKVEIEFPTVKVYVNDSDEPSLQVEQISERKKGGVGLWVGNNSEGGFKNLKVITY